MNRLKRVAAAAAAVALSLSMISFAGAPVGAAPDESARFDEFLASLPAALTSSHDLSIHLQFNDPQAFGFQAAVPEDVYKRQTSGLPTIQQVRFAMY